MTTDSSTSVRCPLCGTRLNFEAPGGLCPRCLMLQAVAFTRDDIEPVERQSPPSLEVIAAAFPHLQILELIGQGGMGVVYKALQKSLNRVVALKIMLPQHETSTSFPDRFSREAQRAGRVKPSEYRHNP